MRYDRSRIRSRWYGASSVGSGSRKSSSGSALGVEVHEHEAAPAVDAHRARAARPSGRSVNSSASTTVDRRAVERVPPRRGSGHWMHAVGEVPAPVGEPGAAVQARVVERADRAVRRRARRGPTRRRSSYSTKSPGARELFLAARDLPHARPQALELEIGELGRRVPRLGHEAVGVAPASGQVLGSSLDPALRATCENRS